MGKYVNKTKLRNSIGSSFEEKKRALIEDGAKQVPSTPFIENMVCLVDNGFFAAAAYMYSEDEFEDFKDGSGRHMEYFEYENVKEVAE
jgi:hypothetical protein